MYSINYFKASRGPEHRHIVVVSSYFRPWPEGPPWYLRLESDCSKSICVIFMIFVDLLYRMYGYNLPKFHLIFIRIDDVTGAGTYKYDHIFSNLRTGDTYREEFCLFIPSGTDINNQITFRKHSHIIPCYLQASKTALDQKLL